MPKVALFSVRPFEKQFLDESFTKVKGADKIKFVPFECRLTESTVKLVKKNFDAVAVFCNDTVNDVVLQKLHEYGIKMVSCRSAGFDHVDLKCAKELNITVTRVPKYSPNAIAEFAVGLILNLNRKIHKAYARCRDDNFLLNGLLGFDLNGKTVGVVGTGNIGQVFANIMLGFGCKVVAFDVFENDDLKAKGVEYRSDLTTLLAESDIVSLHCPLLESTTHMINAESLKSLKKGAMLINTSRGGLLDTPAVIEALKSGVIGHLGIDVYERESTLFALDWSDAANGIIQDDDFQLLQSFQNVLITAHQAWFTREAVTAISDISVDNIVRFFENNLSKETKLC